LIPTDQNNNFQLRYIYINNT